MPKRSTARDDLNLAVRLHPLLDDYLVPHSIGDDGETLWVYKDDMTDAQIAKTLNVDVSCVTRIRKGLFGPLARGSAGQAFSRREAAMTDIEVIQDKLDRLTEMVRVVTSMLTHKSEPKFMPLDNTMTINPLGTNGAAE